MKNIVYKLAEDFNIEKNYKLFRIYQEMLNPIINKKKFEDIDLNLQDRKIMVRCFNLNKNKKKLIIYFHGGGWVTGSVNSYTNAISKLANNLDCMIIMPEYRLAPEYPFPAGFDDCFEVTKLILNNLDEIKVKKNDVILMGDSAGGNLAAAVSQKGLDTKDFRVNKQVLLYPALQSNYSNDTKYTSVISNGNNYLITQKQIQDFMKHYIKDEKDYANPYVAPLLAKHLFGLPKTLIIVNEFDPLRDEGIAYAKKLRWHLVWSEYYVFEGAMHGFLTNILDRKYTKMAYLKIKEFIK